MANFKRGKTKRRVRCTLCTPVKWLGNNKGRKKADFSERRDREKLRKFVLEQLN